MLCVLLVASPFLAIPAGAVRSSSRFFKEDAQVFIKLSGPSPAFLCPFPFEPLSSRARSEQEQFATPHWEAAPRFRTDFLSIFLAFRSPRASR